MTSTFSPGCICPMTAPSVPGRSRRRLGNGGSRLTRAQSRRFNTKGGAPGQTLMVVPSGDGLGTALGVALGGKAVYVDAAVGGGDVTLGTVNTLSVWVKRQFQGLPYRRTTS